MAVLPAEIIVGFIPTLRVVEGESVQLDSLLTLIGLSSVGIRVTISAEDGSAKRKGLPWLYHNSYRLEQLLEFLYILLLSLRTTGLQHYAAKDYLHH